MTTIVFAIKTFFAQVLAFNGQTTLALGAVVEQVEIICENIFTVNWIFGATALRMTKIS